MGTYLMPSVVVARRSALEQVGLFDPSAVPVEDWDLWLRLADAGSFVYLSLALCRYRTRGGTLQELLRRASDKVMDSITYVIRKTVESQPQRYPAAFGDHALGMTRASSALASYELGDTPRGRRMMTLAVEADPVLAQREHLTWMLENHARRIVDDTGDETKAIHFLDQVIHNLPPGVDAAELSARRVLSRIYLADVFRAADAQDRTSMRRKLWAGLRLDPTWLMNRGVLSLMARSLFA